MRAHIQTPDVQVVTVKAGVLSIQLLSHDHFLAKKVSQCFYATVVILQPWGPRQMGGRGVLHSHASSPLLTIGKVQEGRISHFPTSPKPDDLPVDCQTSCPEEPGFHRRVVRSFRQPRLFGRTVELLMQGQTPLLQFSPGHLTSLYRE